MNLKCPLGQLTREQIDKGRAVLDDCKDRINNKAKTDIQEYDRLTSQFYSLIPHVLPHKIRAEDLRLNAIERIMEKHDTLDTFLDAKNVSNVLDKKASVDAKYEKLRAKIEWLDLNSKMGKWLSHLFHNTRASNHGWLGRIKIHNIFRLQRNEESNLFLNRAEEIMGSRKNRKWKCPDTLMDFNYSRPAEKNLLEIYEGSNTVPLFHGTRTENMVGIITRGLLIRPSGAVYTGSMFGDGLYYGFSSKALNYSSCRGTYWARGNDNKGYLFMSDVCLGDPKVVEVSGRYSANNIKPKHSVWAKAGRALVNDEFITYHPSGPKQQHKLEYILEVESQAK
jgi:poly [ADP-ribose] polymerase